ncbi:hypothetical protein [Chryseobacterium echinoideorum]|uniref:hypothetical protein n=1 Tax=Chryseobacterium echinoideorum TaxID=1549648 RepID=UPI001185B278|nr:hypothetical protein [Chryseobacterium echinoideorum]
MEITIKDLYKNLDSLPKSLYGIVYECLNLLKKEANTDVPEWQKEEVKKRIELAELYPESLISSKDINDFMKELEDEI